MKGYKFVTADLKSKYGNCQWVVGEWKKADGELKICENGLHASETALDSLNYPYGDRWFIIDAQGDMKKDGGKFVAREMRLIVELPVKEVLVKFAILCARRCYKNWKVKYPEDKRVWNAILVAERYLKNPTEENRSAARNAARNAASAAWSATRSAESAAASAESAARSAERKWQLQLLNRLIKKQLKKGKE